MATTPTALPPADVTTAHEATTSIVEVTTKATLSSTSSVLSFTSTETSEAVRHHSASTTSTASTTAQTSRTTTNSLPTTRYEEKRRKVKLLEKLRTKLVSVSNEDSVNLAKITFKTSTTVKPNRKVVWSSSTFPPLRSVARTPSNPRDSVSSQRDVLTDSDHLDSSNVRHPSSNPDKSSSQIRDAPRVRKVEKLKLSSPNSFIIRGGSVLRDDRIPLIRAENVKINIGGDVKVSFHAKDPSSFVNPKPGKFSSSPFRKQDPDSTFVSSSFNIPRSERTRTVRRIFLN